MRRRDQGWRETATGLAVGAVAITLVTLLVAALKASIDPIGLDGLYLLAIVPVAIGWGFVAGGIVALASYLTFEYFFVEPIHSFAIANADTAIGLAISMAAAYLFSYLAGLADERAREAQLRAHQAEAAQTELQRLADQQAAVRRVATLVARGAPNAEVFRAVTREIGLQCDADFARLERYEPDRTVSAVAAWTRGDGDLRVGIRIPLEGESIAARVLETGAPTRVQSFERATGPIAREMQSLGIRSSVGCPIIVGGAVWGVIAASTTREAPFPPDTESRIADFTELVGTAVANAEARAELVGSRARIVTAGDEARRRVVRDLHDGAQQRLVQTILTLNLAARATVEGDESGSELVNEALEYAQLAIEELRELAHGLLPAALTRGGLREGVDALVSRLHMRVPVVVPDARLPAEIEASAYFVVAEALTNVAKHARAEHVEVTAAVDNDTLRIDVCDDGVGGARLEGSGLVGLRDRVTTFGGELYVDSPPGGGTRVTATLPLSSDPVTAR
jgi:signal transduction histidine kinase